MVAQARTGWIRGEGLEFTEQERKTVQAKQHISDYYGPTNISNITSSGGSATFNVSFGVTDARAIADFVASLDRDVKRLGLRDDAVEEMRTEIATLKAQATSPKPKPNILKSGLESVARILAAAAVKEAAGPLMHRAHELLQRLR